MYSMGTLGKIKGFRFYYYKSELDEPPHVHFTDGKNIGKIWLRTRRWAVKSSFNESERRKINAAVKTNQKIWLAEVEKSLRHNKSAFASKSGQRKGK